MRSSLKWVTVAILGALGLPCVAQGQVILSSPAVRLRAASPVRTVTSGSNVISSASGVATTANAANSAGGEDPKQKRLQKINQLQFDRRPSAILKAWLEVAQEEKAAAKKAEAEKAKAAATPAAEAKPAEDNTEEVKKPEEPKKEEPRAEATKPVEAAAAEAKPVETKPADAPPASATPTDPAKPEEAAAAPAKSEQELKAEQEKKAAEEKAAQERAVKEKEKAEKDRIKAEQEKAEKAFDAAIKKFQRDVTLGHWNEVKAFIASLEKDEAKAAYARLLEVLRSGQAQEQQMMDPQMLQQMLLNSADQPTLQAALSAGGQGPGAQFLERNRFSMADIAGLIQASPHKLEEADFTKLGTIIRQALGGGIDLEELLRQLHVLPGDTEPRLERREVARLLSASGQELRAGDFLPKLEEARRDGDAQGLNLLARYYLAKHGEEKKMTYLENAWLATQGVLGLELPPEPPKPDMAATSTPQNAAVANAAQQAATQPTAEQLAARPAEPAKSPEVIAAEAKAAAEKTAAAKAAAEEAAEVRRKYEERKGDQVAALRRAVELAPRIRKELGQKWLDESFTTHIERGREILVTLGTLVGTNLQSRPQDADFRLKTVELQRTAVESLLRAAPETANAWRDALTLLASNWLKEADVSYRYDMSQQNQTWRRDRYGNFFFMDQDGNSNPYRFQQQQIAAIPTNDLLDARPGDAWLKLVDADLQPKFATTFSQLYLKSNEDAKAFPYIEQLAKTHPIKAREQAQEFLRVWTKNHNPNEGRERENPYMYYWGYEQRADRIPLTRSKQERNLKELGGWLARLRALPIEALDEQLVANAFTTSHSKAEVYRLEAIEEVLGPMETIKPRTLSELIQQMRGNLASVWRLPDVQKQNSTNRKQRDIQAEVQRGYELALKVVRQALEKHPNHWALVMAEAAVLHDENDFRQEVAKSSEFSAKRQVALDRFKQAADLYAKAVPELTEEEQSIQVYEQWFYAGLGAVDLGRITADKVGDLRQPALIRDAINALPPEIAARHQEQFANNLVTRANGAKPELKFRYLKGGFEIVGDHKMAREARKLLDYYGDLVSEIRLEARVDGPDTVGHDQPFGVFVNLVHTKEIERESGGFGRYLQNQNSNQAYFYNFGRPTQNYRDKFRDTVTQAVGEQFDVVSITFQEPEVNSRATSEYGWRMTPYAYLLLKAKGPEIDKISPVRLDLDFLDTSGFAMLPVETPAVPVDAKGKAAPRPSSQITLTQTLDERQSRGGKLIVEVRAAGRGLMPTLEELLEFKVPGFKQDAVDGGDLSVTQFDKEAAESTILSERTWLVTLKADNAQAAPAEKFQFAKARVPLKEAIYQRYEDADLVAVEPEVVLGARYKPTSYAWLWFPLVGVAVVAVGGFAAWRAARGRQREVVRGYQVPEPATPLNVLGLLRDIQLNNGLCEADKRELQTSIAQLEHHYFAEPEPQEPDLHTIAKSWVAKSSGPHR